jgi:putative membrane protein
MTDRPAGKVIPFALLLVGLGIGFFAFDGINLSEIRRAVAAIGMSDAILILVSYAMTAVCLAAGWKVLVPNGEAPTLNSFIGARLVRDSVAEILPFSQVGGFAAGTRALTLAGTPAAMSVASMAAAIAAEMISQTLHLGIGAAYLLRSGIAEDACRTALAGAAIAIPAAIGFVLVQIHGDRLVPVRLRGFVAAMMPDSSASEKTQPGNDGETIGAAVPGERAATKRIWLGEGRPVLSVLLHLIGWILLGAQAWLILRGMGFDVDPIDVLAAEALIHGAKSLAFAVPNAIGVQEMAYAAMGTALGIGPEAGLALSLVKRARDFMIGVPVIIGWAIIEGRKFRKRENAKKKDA